MRIINDNCEFVTIDLLRNIDESRSQVAIRIATDEEIEKLSGRKAFKDIQQRISIAKSIKGVNYILYGEKLIKVENRKPKKFHKYKLGYVPGTYDLLHSGHIENIKYAQNMCDIVVVGVNSDDLVWKNKSKKTMQNQKTRKFVMEHIKGVDYVIFALTNDKSVINEKIMAITKFGINAIFLGGDLKGKNAMNQEGDLDGVDYIYTPRSETKMKTVSSTAFRKSLTDLEKMLLEENAMLKERNEYLSKMLEAINKQF